MQNGQRADAEAIRLEQEVALPTFDAGDGLSAGGVQAKPMQPAMPDPAKDLPDLDDLDFSTNV